MNTERKQRRIGLRTKLNTLLIACILLISLGLLLITYRVYCEKVDSFYFDQAQRAASVAAEDYVSSTYMAYLREMVDTDEYRQVREKAVAANDEEIIRDWLLSKPSYDENYFQNNPDQLPEDAEVDFAAEDLTLLSDYQYLASLLERIRPFFDINSVYLQFVRDDVTYNLVDPDESLLVLGSPEEKVAAFDKYKGNVRIPPTVYQYEKNWLCTACEPVINLEDESRTAIGVVGVDIDMNDVVRERHWFLINSALFIALLTVLAIVVSMILIQKLATEPLRLLARGATGFAKGNHGYTGDDVIQLPIRSRDEIGDLYHEIQSMQRRIVDYTNSLTRITAERERNITEMRMAAKIQSAMLPNQFPAFPECPEFDLYATMNPAKAVGGDFYDFFLIDDDHLAIEIADVSDKGVPAALFMMSSKMIINYRAQMGGTPGEILTAANDQLCRENKSGMFVTVWLGILELSTGRLTCTNAGHEYPILRGQDGAFRVYKDKHGLAVGAMDFTRYHDYELVLSPGEAVFVYTDGVPEANNAKGEFYGMERLEAALNRIGSADPRGILEGIRADVDAFVDGADQFDDLTMLCLTYRGKGR